jgi:hypothetical protein
MVPAQGVGGEARVGEDAEVIVHPCSQHGFVAWIDLAEQQMRRKHLKQHDGIEGRVRVGVPACDQDRVVGLTGLVNGAHRIPSCWIGRAVTIQVDARPRTPSRPASSASPSRRAVRTVSCSSAARSPERRRSSPAGVADPGVAHAPISGPVTIVGA